MLITLLDFRIEGKTISEKKKSKELSLFFFFFFCNLSNQLIGFSEDIEMLGWCPMGLVGFDLMGRDS